MGEHLAQHIVNISGGKDSASCYLLAIMRGKPFRAVTADTGHENEITYDWISKLSARTGGPEVEVVKADFADRIARKRASASP
ncbi:phosphoadenosine phosphosulfate reductase domain-containing protein [Halovulum sp. GXIMD14793]